MHKLWQVLGFSIIAALTSISPAHSCSNSQSQSTILYSEFISRVQADEINQVRISADRSYAIFYRKPDNSPVRVNLPTDPTLIETLVNNGVDITVMPPER
jgi:cell division protease FtsH